MPTEPTMLAIIDITFALTILTLGWKLYVFRRANERLAMENLILRHALESANRIFADAMADLDKTTGVPHSAEHVNAMLLTMFGPISPADVVRRELVYPEKDEFAQTEIEVTNER